MPRPISPCGAIPISFDERLNAPKRALAASTLHQQREHIRLAASVLIESGIPKEDIKSLSDLVEAERFKLVLRHYLGSDGKPNAFVISIGKTLIQVAYYHVGADAEHLARLTAIAAKLPSIPFDLTAKNAALLRQFELPKLRAKLLFLPEVLIAEVREALEGGAFHLSWRRSPWQSTSHSSSRFDRKIYVRLSGGGTSASRTDPRGVSCFISPPRRRSPRRKTWSPKSRKT